VASSVPPARHFVQRTLDAWDLSSVSWTAALVVTELAANAALHAGTEFTVEMAVDGGRLRLEVRDGSAHLPRTRLHSLEATTGRGLRLVADLSADWGVQPRDGGKTVWVELSTADSGPGAGDADAEAVLSAFPLDAQDESDIAGQGGGVFSRVA
jgi:anti-sigma regulatory factor (Ser/Thr protein kinase)